MRPGLRAAALAVAFFALTAQSYNPPTINQIGGGPLAVGGGGTGATTAAAAATNLALGTGNSPTFAGLTLGTPLPIGSGGTNAITAAAAATSLGLGTGNSPTFAGETLTGALLGGSAAGSTLTIKSTSNATPSGDAVTIQTSNINLSNAASFSTTVNIGTANSSGVSGIAIAGTSSGALTLHVPAAASGSLTLGSLNTAQSTPANPTAPNSAAAFTMQGLAGAITPGKSGTILVWISGYFTASTVTAGDGILAQLSYGTGTAPTSNAALTGTQIGAQMKYRNDNTVVAADVAQPFAMQTVITGLAVGTAVWLDLAAESVTTASSVGIAGVTITAIEL